MRRDFGIVFTKIDMSKSMEIVTGVIKADQIRDEIPIIADLLTRHDIQLIDVMYGRGCNLELDGLYKEFLINARSLQSFVEGSVRQNIYKYGESDLWINSTDQAVIFQLSHESRIHFRTSDESFLKDVRSTWILQDFPGYDRIAKRWVPWTTAKISTS